MAVAASEPKVLSDSNMIQVSTNAYCESFQCLSFISRIDFILALYQTTDERRKLDIFGHNEQNFNGDRIMVKTIFQYANNMTIGRKLLSKAKAVIDY